MILQSLCDYYERRAADPDSGIAPQGWEWKALPFIVEVDPSGELVQVSDTRREEGKRVVARRYLVPLSVKRTVGIASNLLWDNVEYALGIAVRGAADRVARQHAAFVGAITAQFGARPADAGVAALLRFLLAVPASRIRADPLWGDLETNPFISFRLAGETELIGQREAVRVALAAGGVDDEDGICLVTGSRGAIARLHPAIKGVRGANTQGASLVSYNLDAFTSYGKIQGANAPVSVAAAFAYTTALNDLLQRDSGHAQHLADTTIVFWAERSDASEFEAAFAGLFEEAPRDDPSRHIKALAAVYESVRTGAPITADDGTRFFILALAPNAARLSVRDWRVATVRQVAQRIVQHFDDLSIVLPTYERPHPSLYRIVSTISVQGKVENAAPDLVGDVLRAILAGGPYPSTLLQAAVSRSRMARQSGDRSDPMPVIAATIKAVLNRRARQAAWHTKELTVSLDPDNPEPSYRLGRLFAVLERAQEMANPGINSTIRERYYGAASTNPATVFSQLLKLKNHHVAKLDKPGMKAWIEKQIGEIMDGLSDFPAHLVLAEQGSFAIGYYHQRQSFFAGKADQA